MKIDELKNSAIDITPVEEIIPDPRETEIQTEEIVEPTPEEKEQTEKFLRSAVIKKHRWILIDLINRMKSKHLSIDQIKEEIEQKKSPFSASQREFISSFKTEFLTDLLKDMLNQRELHEINIT